MVPLETVLRKAEVTGVRADFEHLGPKPVSIVNQALRAADKEITRLTQELEAAKCETAEARDKALESAFDLAADAWRAQEAEFGYQPVDEVNELPEQIRALKSNHESKDTQGGT